MPASQVLKEAWSRHWKLHKQRPEPFWARFVVVTGIGLAFALVVALVLGGFNGRLVDRRWFGEILLPACFVGIGIAWTSKLVFRSAELALPEATLARLNGRPDWFSTLFFSVMGLGGALSGWALSLNLLGWVVQQDVWGHAWRGVPSLIEFIALSALFSGLGAWVASSRWRQRQLGLRATEAQLKLLQAQIEPHFLFNTLANVRSLIDCEPQRAGEMLDVFTQHLRSSLGAMRAELLPLERELELVGQYLRLMKLRMCDRLEFEIVASAAARAVQVPPLLLQPLVENAIRHGIENKVEGGHVRIHAEVFQGRLQLTVSDDGCGLDAPRRRDHKGNGVALANIRERLLSRYGESASLELQAAEPCGTEAHIEIPLTAAP